jgi:hypothetical protein
MGDQPTDNEKRFDPFEPWRGMRDAYLDAWSKSMIDGVNSEAYAKATGAMLDTYLAASSPFKETMEKAMLKALEQLSMPSRADLLSLAERFTNIEMRLDDMDAKFDELSAVLSKVPQPAPGQQEIELRLAELDSKLERILGVAKAKAAEQLMEKESK